MVGMLFASAALAEEAQPSELDVSKVTGIQVKYNFWTGHFGPKGEARLSKILDGEYEVRAPEGSFSLEEIYALVASHLKQYPATSSAGVLDIVFYFRDTDPRSKDFYIEDQQVMRTLMYGVRDKAVPPSPVYSNHLAHTEGVFSRYPLVPGDKPAPFKYSEETHRIAREFSVVTEKIIQTYTNAESNAESIAEFERAWSEAVQKYHEKMSKRKLPTAMQNEGRAKPSRRAADGETGIENNASDGSPETASPYLCVGILAALCAGAVIWFIRKRR